jgi:hypothetical protein
MSNYGIRIDLLKLKGAFMRNLKGSTATKRCLIIPVDDCESIFLGEKGCYLNMTGIEMENPQYNDTHCIKGDIPKEKREQMTDEQRKNVPILGGMRPLQSRPQQTMQVSGQVPWEQMGGDDLPF